MSDCVCTHSQFDHYGEYKNCGHVNGHGFLDCPCPRFTSVTDERRDALFAVADAITAGDRLGIAHALEELLRT